MLFKWKYKAMKFHEFGFNAKPYGFLLKCRQHYRNSVMTKLSNKKGF